MSLHKKSSSVRGWWRHAGRNFVGAQWRRVGLGCIVGALVGMGLHLLTRDFRFASFLHQKWAELVMTKRFDGLRAYKAEVVALCIGIFAIAVIPTLLWLWRYVRSWWAGLTSVMVLLAACATLAALTCAPNYPKATTALGLASLATVVMIESWRQRRGVPVVAAPKPNIPTVKTNTSAEQRWQAPTSDDPIGDWDEDIVGRAAVVELLADHALRLRTPVVALHGGLGDGKSSVLNLFRRAVEGQAIVVSFSAWLPGSEVTLAADLFRDIAAECGRHVHVPQLRKRALAYARTVSGSVSYLAGLKELLPTQSQREEVQELREALSRVPMPILVLLDEIDRMQKEELLVLLKILRGASSIPNVTFVCAFSEEEIKKELCSRSFDYLEKFFPVSIRLSAPDPDMLGACFQARLKMGLAEQKWFRTGQDAEKFAGMLEQVWQDALSKVCTNFRKAGLLVNDILNAARPIFGEVNPLDLTLIEAVSRFYPPIYRLVRTNRLLLTYGDVSLTKGEYLTQEHKKKKRDAFLNTLNSEVVKCPEPGVAETLLSWLFPDYATPSGENRFFYASVRQASEDIAEDEKRICSGDYFPIYFRAAVPEEMFSNAELDRIVLDLREAAKADIEIVFNRTLNSIPPKHPKRADFLWKLSRQLDRFDDVTAEGLACAVAQRAADYAYDILNVGEAARALNIVFTAAQKLATTPGAQRVLEGAMVRATDDTFAIRLLGFTEQRDRNKILTDFSNVDVTALKRVFIQRMRERYGADRDIQAVNIAQGDWHAFRSWAGNSEEDREIERGFWRRFIGQSRKRLAQAINFVFPGNVGWEGDPNQAVNSIFPTDEFARLLEELPNEKQLDEIETKGISRMQKLLAGEYRWPFEQ